MFGRKGQEVELETGISEFVMDQVAEKGHRVMPVNAIGGGMCIVRFEPGGLLSGASCWRADGHAVGIGGGFARSGVRFRPSVGEKDPAIVMSEKVAVKTEDEDLV